MLVLCYCVVFATVSLCASYHVWLLQLVLFVVLYSAILRGSLFGYIVYVCANLWHLRFCVSFSSNFQFSNDEFSHLIQHHSYTDISVRWQERWMRPIKNSLAMHESVNGATRQEAQLTLRVADRTAPAPQSYKYNHAVHIWDVDAVGRQKIVIPSGIGLAAVLAVGHLSWLVILCLSL